MKPRSLFLRLARARALSFAAATIAIAASQATATTYTWTQTAGGTYAWDTPANWGGTTPLPAADDTVDLSTVNIAANVTLTLDADRTAGVWKFGDTNNDRDWTINTGTPGGKLVLAGTTPAVNVVQRTTTVNAVVDGTAGLVKLGNGTLVLAGANTYTGSTTISAGTLQIGAGGATGALDPTSGIENNATLRFQRNNTLTQGTDFGTISGTGGIIQQSGTTVLNASNSFTGSVRCNGGTLNAATIGNAGENSPLGAYATTSANGIVLANGTLNYTGPTATSDRGVSIAGDWGQGTMRVSTAGASLTMGNLTRSDAKDNRLNVTGGAAGTNLTFTTVTNNNNLYFTNDANTTLTLSSMTGIGATQKMGAGTLYLNGSNTSFSGNINLEQGKLVISNDDNLGTGQLQFNGGTLQFDTGSTVTLNPTRAIVINSGKTAVVDTSLANGSIDSVLTGSGNLSKNTTGDLTLNGLNTFSGTTTISNGTIKIGNARSLQNSAYVTTGSNGTTIGLDVNGNAQPVLGGLSGTVALASAAIGYSGVSALTLNPLSGTQTYNSVIADGATGMTLTKTGGGTQVLGGVNAYTGNTSVQAGVLRITGSIASDVSVTGGGIGGSGNGTTTGLITGNVTVSGSGAVDLRDGAIGNLAITGDLLMNGTSNSLYFDLANGGTTTDKLVVTGDVTVTNPGSLVIGLNALGASRIGDNTYTLIETTGTAPEMGDLTLPPGKINGLGLAFGATANAVTVTTTQLAAGPAAAFWSGAATANWSDAGNWNTDAAGAIAASGAPSYQSNVTFHTTTPAAVNLTTSLDADFDVNSLTFSAAATAPVTIGGTNTLAIEATNANGNTAGVGITVATPSSGTVEHSIAAKLGVAANQSWTVNPSATLTVTGAVSDYGANRTLTKLGSGLLNLNGATQVGNLSVGYNATGSMGTVQIGSGGSLSVGYGPASNFYVGWSDASKNGSGVLDASAATSVVANVARLMVGGTTGSTGTLRLGANNDITAATEFAIERGTWGGPNGYGTVTTAAGSTTTIRTPLMYVGNNIPNGTTGGWGKFTLGSGADLTLEGLSGGRTDLSVSWFWSGNGSSESTPSRVDLSGGEADLMLSSLIIGRREAGGGSGNYGFMTMSSDGGNSLDVSSPGTPVQVGFSTSTSTVDGSLTIGGGVSTITSTSNLPAIMLATKMNSGATNGTLNLHGGTMTLTTTAAAITGGGGTSNVNLNGATLKAGASTSSFLTGLSNARIYGGGVTFDTNGNDITVPQGLVTPAGGGYGLTAMETLVPTSGGSGYTGEPTVTFNTPVGGLAATGYAKINAAGQVTGIVVTNPGSGYTNGGTATISLSGGGGTGATFTNPTATVAQFGGGLTKTGAGTLTLGGINTYTGNTTVSAGSLVLADNAGLKFVVTDGGSNKVTGAGGATLDGDFTIDVSAVTATSGSWPLVDTSGKSFTSNFTVAGWTEASNVWTLVAGDNTWTFKESDGKLYLNAATGGYGAWASGFSDPALANTAADADPDGDGLANSLEYVLGTDPRYSNPGGPSVTAAGANLVVTFSRSDASETPDLALVVEAGTDLATWPLVYNIGADTTGSSAGVEITENENAPDTITVTIPKGFDEKKFARLRAVVTE